MLQSRKTIFRLLEVCGPQAWRYERLASVGSGPKSSSKREHIARLPSGLKDHVSVGFFTVFQTDLVESEDQARKVLWERRKGRVGKRSVPTGSDHGVPV